MDVETFGSVRRPAALHHLLLLLAVGGREMSTAAVETLGGERIDQLVSSVRTESWLAAVALILLAGSGASWMWLGHVRDVVLAPGVLVTGSGPVPVAAPVSGSLAEVFVRAGQDVTPGTALGVVADAHGVRRVVTSATSGRVLRTAAPGTALAAGGAVAVVDPATGPLRALLVVGHDRIASLTAGQAVAVGGAKGKVSAIDSYPTTGDRLRPLYGDALKADGRFVVTVDLDRPAWPGATLTPVVRGDHHRRRPPGGRAVPQWRAPCLRRRRRRRPSRARSAPSAARRWRTPTAGRPASA